MRIWSPGAMVLIGTGLPEILQVPIVEELVTKVGDGTKGRRIKR